MNLAVLLFYGSKPEGLEDSLARILVDFYPLAGRYIKEQSLVECNDAGAEFVTAQATDVVLNDLVGTNDADILQHVYPDSYYRCDEEASNPLLSIQATHFPCGGAIIAVSVSHRIFDIPSITTFISAWSSAHHPNKSVQVRLEIHKFHPKNNSLYDKQTNRLTYIVISVISLYYYLIIFISISRSRRLSTSRLCSPAKSTISG